MSDEQKTIVLFRVDSDGTCFAIFPFVQETARDVATFDMLGGHSHGPRLDMIETSRPATPAEYERIARVLASGPYRYRLVIRQRTPRANPYR